MAKTLVIKQLRPKTDSALERYKSENTVLVNTKAAMAMIEEYHSLKDQLEKQQLFYLLRARYSKLWNSVKAKRDAEEVISGMLESEFVDGDIVLDSEFGEEFTFSEGVDGYRARATNAFQLSSKNNYPEFHARRQNGDSI